MSRVPRIRNQDPPAQEVHAGRLRQNRILNEVFDMGDPLKLMRLFGITEKTAMHYIGVAHAEKTAQHPR
ncbi:hypothetical protein GCM10010420_56310 [Streptomyces glaucosporus]|uniref:DUF433 domain-containing protein n=1 Tax=Streptomyces glaucosporus TaxID=284044 RepID=A0ABN3J0M5_9ACTN